MSQQPNSYYLSIGRLTLIIRKYQEQYAMRNPFKTMLPRPVELLETEADNRKKNSPITEAVSPASERPIIPNALSAASCVKD